jgi:hypothetical protein
MRLSAISLGDPMARSEEERRRAPRVKLFQPAEMRNTSGQTTRVHLLNVSTTGALVYGDAAPGIGEELSLACGIALGEARVAWRVGRRFGVAFARPIAPAQVEAMVRAQDELIESASRRLGVPQMKMMA